MAKDRISFAKRQREMERKRKAEEKRQRRKRNKPPADPPADGDRSSEVEPRSARAEEESALSPGEVAVLEVFRRFRMGHGQMLCFSRSDLETLRVPLSLLADNGLLVAEKFHGGYSLTPAGYIAMRDVP